MSDRGRVSRAWTNLLAQLRRASPPLAALLEHLVERRINSRRYRILSEIARGGMGIVFRVVDEDLDRTLAMKVAREPLPLVGDHLPNEYDALFHARFLRELRITGQLNHPGIVALHDVGIDEHDRLFFTMKLVEGENLATILRAMKHSDERWTLPKVLEILLRVCDAMSHAHSLKIIHRDLKPSNIMVGRFSETYVMDWGLARFLDEPEPQVEDPDLERPASPRSRKSASLDETLEAQTLDGEAVGTPSYMAPEQALGVLERVGPLSDVYSVGAILYHALTGELPYTVPRDGSSAKKVKRSHNVLSAVASGDCATIESLNPNAPPELVAICERAMARDFEKRYASMEGLGDDLRAYLEGRVVTAYESGPWAELKKWYRRNRKVALPAILFVFALSTAIGFGLRNSELVQKWTHVQDAASRRIGALEADLAEARSVATQGVDALAAAQKNADDAARLRSELQSQLEAANLAVSNARKSADERLLESARITEENERLKGAASELGKQIAEVKRLESEIERLKNAAPSTPPASQDSRIAIDAVKAAVEIIDVRERLARLASPLKTSVADYESWLADHKAALLDVADSIAAIESGGDSAPAYLRQLALVLHRLRDDLESGNKGALGSDLVPTSSEVEKLAAQARTLDDVRTKSPPSGALTWEQAREELAKIPGFDGVVLGKQDDLLPIGRNPDSGLLEFWHVLSGSLPKRDAKRRIVRSDGDGLVFVLLPGGEFRMGAQRERSSDRGGIDFDPEAEVNEANKGGEPVKVALDPYFIATTEISFAQWQRFFRRVAPAHFALGSSWVFAKGSPPEVITGSHPCEGVTWDEANALLLRYGLSLPTEAQWEYAGRAIPALSNKRGPDPDGVPWWFGDRGAIEKLANFGNILDHKRGALFMTPSAEDQKVEDAFTLTAPVGSFAPNPVGLFDVIGNVSEWCLDARVDRYDEPPRAADGLRGHGDRGVEDQHPYRGGDYRSTSHFARLTARRFGRHDESLDNVGVRPVRLLPR